MTVNFRMSVLAVAVLGLAAALPVAQANPVLYAESYTRIDQQQLAGVLVDEGGYVHSNSQQSSSTGIAYATGFSRETGSYAVRSLVQGDGAAQATSTFHYELENNTGVNQIYALKFKIYGGSISTLLGTGGVLDQNSELLQAGYYSTIRIDGEKSKGFVSDAYLQSSGDGSPVLIRGGEVFNQSDDGSDGEYRWDDQYVNLAYAVAAGETLSFEAEMTAWTYNLLLPQTEGCGGGGEPPAAAAHSTLISVGDGSCFKGASSAFYGDPFNADASIGFTYTYSPANVVPEPGAIALAGLGLVLVGATRRRRLAV